MKQLRWFLVLVGMAACLGMIAGCGDDETPLDPVETVILPGTADLLVSEFVTVLEEKNADRLAELLHADARVFLLPSTLQEWEQSGNPLGFTYFGRDSLLGVHQIIFSGQNGMAAIGVPIPPVSSIQVDLFAKAGIWDLNVDEADNFSGLEVYSALYHVLIYFNNPDQHRFEIRQDVEIFATQVEDAGLSGWQLLGWRGFQSASGAAATESTTWGDILTWYR